MPLPTALPCPGRALLAAALFSQLFIACTLPKASYRQVDESSAAYRAALSEETLRLQTVGKSSEEAAKLAPAQAKEAIIEAEKARRTAGVAPLAQVMTAFDRPRGCWAYTVTKTRTVDGVATVTVERFDPFEPEARIWTLLSRNGEVPDAAAQAAYREERIRKWKKSIDRKSRGTNAEHLSSLARLADFEVATTETEKVTEYRFGRKNMGMALVGNTGEYRHTYVVDHAHATLLRRSIELLTPAAILANTTKIAYLHSTTDYTVIDPALPPFISRVATQFRGSLLGKDTGDVTEEAVYSDYRRVKCYDDRFEVKIGPPSASDFLPE